ncbi:MAG: hypothetical protein V5A68_03615 [Candidatus Thermoplasmatota archaeon]
MNKKILLFALITVVLLLLTPTFPAMKLKLVHNSFKEKILNGVKESETMNNNRIQKITGEKNLKNSNLRDLYQSIQSSFSKKKDKDDGSTQQNLYLLDIIIIFLLILTFFKGIPNFFQNILSFITNLSNDIALLLSNILSFMYKSFVFIGETSLNIIIKIGKLLFKAIAFTGVGILAVIAGVILLIGLVIFGMGYGIIKLVGLLWKGLGTFLGLILDILRLIYEAVFKPENIATS